MAILEYDRNPKLTAEQKIQSLMESVQRAFNEIEMHEPEKKGILTIPEGGTGGKTSAESLSNLSGGKLTIDSDGEVTADLKAVDADEIKSGGMRLSFTPAELAELNQLVGGGG